MLFQELNFFVQGWRGFLVGQPRGWHAHHRSEAQGHREGWILPRETLQVGQLRRAASLTVELLARGGRLWGFGFGGGVQTSGFTWWARAVPGVLSNSFFCPTSTVTLGSPTSTVNSSSSSKKKSSSPSKTSFPAGGSPPPTGYPGGSPWTSPAGHPGGAFPCLGATPSSWFKNPTSGVSLS